MGTLTTITVFVWMVNGLIFLSQIAMLNINPALADQYNVFYSSENSVLAKYITNGNISMPDSSMVSSDLQLTEDTSVTDSGGLFGLIDSIAAFKNWIKKSINYVIAILLGPYNILASIPGLPRELVGVISVMWYGVSMFIFFLTITGRAT